MKKALLVIIPLIFIVSAFLIFKNINKPVVPQLKKSEKPIGVRGANPGLFVLLKKAEAKGNLQDIRLVYQKLISESPNSKEVSIWQKKVEELNIKLLFSPAITPKSLSYEIKVGDNLTKIAKEHNTTVELLKKSNNLSDDRIIPGRKIKVWTAPFSIVVDKSQNTLLLKTGEEVFKTYMASTGANNSTPVGIFKIVNKLPNPTWYKAGAVVPPGSPENVLGSRWLGFDLAGYGIHGTVEPESLGKQVTQGCVRLANPEVEELYTIVPVGAEVTIVD
ncbi:MAG: L,D-transpeptidase family protein [Candidatus Omnitrophota bacterium]|nr:L,D-transpeptidase family protein [Candidatus Omnitrophota bacterium]MBU1928657.1 L,D-transpeptidase family protein [Candidatus Omnitrophota bacterium]MBU2035778.1 L,D-transpeptidase family protein [Candidatus Omnitrophota bacterium]MBU2258332.1 L,D-transpeptidase family protein [Candidatus Omnitrophota bacterium]